MEKNQFVKYIEKHLQSDKAATHSELQTANAISQKAMLHSKEQSSQLFFHNLEHEFFHSSYEQELREMDSIRQGDLETLKQCIGENYDEYFGDLADTPIRHAKNLAITLNALSSRAAIQGGLIPEKAFSMSDMFIREIENMNDILSIQHFARSIEFEFCRLVNEIRSGQAGKKADSHYYVELCKKYIYRHLHERIYVRDIAEPT